MFILAVPYTRDGDECRRYRTFGESQQKPDGGESREVVWSSQTHANSTPDDYCNADKFGKMQSAHQVHKRVLCD